MMPISFFYDGTKKEKKRFWIELIPNLIGLAIHGIVYSYSAVVGLFKCGNQKVWKKTKHNVTVLMDELKTDEEEQEEKTA